jgi:hypothetical protein
MKERPKVLDHWEDVRHDPLTIPPDNFDGLALDDAVGLIKDWLLDNFEDAAQSTPYESAEGRQAPEPSPSRASV